MDLNIKVNDKNHLDIGGADACDIVDEFGTPTYVIDENRIRDNYNRFYNAFSKYYPDFKVFYACKANTNLAVMKILESEGCCIDAVSPGEVHISKMLGFSGDRILLQVISNRMPFGIVEIDQVDRAHPGFDKRNMIVVNRKARPIDKLFVIA